MIYNNEYVKRNIYVYLFNFIDGMKMRGVKGVVNGNVKSRNSVVSCLVVRNVCFCFILFSIDFFFGDFLLKVVSIVKD